MTLNVAQTDPFVEQTLESDYHRIMESKISATEAARSLSDLLNRVAYRGESFVVLRGGEAVCRIVPAGPARCTVAELVRVLGAAPRPDGGYFETVKDAVKKQPRVSQRDPWAR